MQRYHMKASHPVIDRVADSEGLYVLASEAFEALTASEARAQHLKIVLKELLDASAEPMSYHKNCAPYNWAAERARIALGDAQRESDNG